MALDEVLRTALGKENAVFSYQVDNIVYVFYLVRNMSDDMSLYLDSIYGAHFRIWLKDREWTPEGHYQMILINLRAMLKGNTYDVRELVGTIIHELIHAVGVKDEDAVYRLERKLLEGYEYSTIEIEPLPKTQ